MLSKNAVPRTAGRRMRSMEKLEQSLIAAAEEEEVLTDAVLQGGDAMGASLYGLEGKRCQFTGCRLAGADLERSSWDDTVFTDCDRSGVSFRDAGLRNVRFVRCKLVGARFQEALLQQVDFTDCTGTYVSFQGARLKSCALTGGTFAEAAFSDTKLQKFRCATDFTRAEFSKTPLSGVDFTACDLSGARYSLDCLRGAVVTSQQAVELAALLGVKVRDHTT
jgi:uncharacterized protein YjbI with pentapeptide repeats